GHRGVDSNAATPSRLLPWTRPAGDERRQAWNIAPENSHSWTALDDLPITTDHRVVPDQYVIMPVPLCLHSGDPKCPHAFYNRPRFTSSKEYGCLPFTFRPTSLRRKDGPRWVRCRLAGARHRLVLLDRLDPGRGLWPFVAPAREARSQASARPGRRWP